MKITISKQDYNKFFIYNYYNGPKRLIRFMRMYMGPVLLVVGLYLYLTYENIEPVFIFFCIGYGAFYILKPLILNLLNKTSDETFEYSFDKDYIHIKDRLNEASFDTRKTIINENKLAYYLKLENGQVIFFPKHKLNDKATKEFIKRM